MALEYVQIHNISEEMVTMDRHLYLTEDRDRVVAEGDPAGRWLWAAPGQRVSRREAERLGAIQPEPPPAPPVEEKQVVQPANKQRRPAANKGGSPRPDAPDPAPGA